MPQSSSRAGPTSSLPPKSNLDDFTQDAHEHVEPLSEMIARLMRRGDAAQGLLVGAQLDNALEDLL